MPETFVEPLPSFKVGPMAIPLIPGRQRLAWTLVLAGWTLVGLGYFASLRYGMAPAPTGTETQLLVYAVGTSWIWAALTPPVLQITGNASFTGRHGLDSSGIYLLAAAGFFLVSGTLEWALGRATGMIAPKAKRKNDVSAAVHGDPPSSWGSMPSSSRERASSAVFSSFIIALESSFASRRPRPLDS